MTTTSRAETAETRLRVYISGPITKGELAHSVNQATAAFIDLAKAGFAPLCPHWSVYAKECKPLPSLTDLNTGVFPEAVYCVGWAGGDRYFSRGDTDFTRTEWLAIDLAWVAVCEAVVRLPGESGGADMETAEARRLGIPVFESVAELVAWSKLSGRVRPNA